MTDVTLATFHLFDRETLAAACNWPGDRWLRRLPRLRRRVRWLPRLRGLRRRRRLRRLRGLVGSVPRLRVLSRRKSAVVTPQAGGTSDVLWASRADASTR
jgi:hypothetical protein